MPILGPTATLLLRRMGAASERAPAGFWLDLELAARSLGLGGAGGRHAPLRRALARCTRYELAAELDPATLAVGHPVRLVPESLADRLPGPLRDGHRAFLARLGPKSGAAMPPVEHRPRPGPI